MSHPFPPTALLRHHAQTVRYSTSSYKIDYLIVIKTFKIPKGIKIPSVVQKLRPFYWRAWFSLLVELYRKGSAPAACAAGFFCCCKNTHKKWIGFNIIYYQVLFCPSKLLSFLFLFFFFLFFFLNIENRLVSL